MKAFALKFPYRAYQAKFPDVTQDVLHICESDTDVFNYPIPQHLKKLSWLQGKNLLGLSETGDIVTIRWEDTTCCIYPQHFGTTKFIDLAVDVKKPWRFIGLTEDLNIIYADFSSHKAIFKKEYHSLIKPLAQLVNFLANKDVVGEKPIIATFNSKRTYRTIMRLSPITESQIYKIWFHNDKIGIYCGDKNNTNGILDIYKLQDRIFTFNMHDVRTAKDKEHCIDKSVKQLDCHILDKK